MIILGYMLIGCSKTSKTNEISHQLLNQLSCTYKAEPNSLEFLEQKYRCKNKK